MPCEGEMSLSPTDSSSGSWLFAGAEKLDDSVRLGETYTYTWDVRERSGPGPSDPSSVVWMYHSHHSEVQDTVTGLYGAIIVSGQVGRISQPGALQDVRDKSNFVRSLVMNTDANVQGASDWKSLWHAGQGKAGWQPKGHRQGVCADVLHCA